MSSFETLGLSPLLLRALCDSGYSTPTPIQQQAIAPILQRRDLLGCAQTGTGKTAAFALPILHNLVTAAPDMTRRGPQTPRVLVLAPTRELAAQIDESFATYGRHTHLRHTVIFGGVGQFHQVKALQRGVDVLVATPGRLIDLLEQRLVNLSAVNTFVLDEADRMLDMGFINPIRRIAAVLPTAPTRQTLLFSATMPDEILSLANSLLNNPVSVRVTPVSSAAPLVTQSVYHVPRATKLALLRHLLADRTISRALVFTRTKHGADRLTRQLNHDGIVSEAIHGNRGQNQRQRALESFRSGRARVLVATDIASRGIDVDGVTHVFNFDMPIEPEAYVHRIGRTGRAGATGVAVSFCDSEEHGMLRSVERLIGKPVPAIRNLPPLPDAPAATNPRGTQHAAPRPTPHAAPRNPQRPAAHNAPRDPARETPRRTSRNAPNPPHGKPRPASNHAPQAGRRDGSRSAPGQQGGSGRSRRRGRGPSPQRRNDRQQ